MYVLATSNDVDGAVLRKEKRVDYNDPALYAGVDWSSVFGNKAATTPPPSDPAPSPTTPPLSDPAPSPSTTPTSDAVAEGAPKQLNVKPPKSSAAPSTPPQGDSNNEDSKSCNGPGMNIAWKGDVVDMSYNGKKGKTQGCTNLGTDFNGQVHVGGEQGTIFEGNHNGGNQFWDVSIILGFTVPMVCSAGNEKSGCNIDLWKGESKCPQKDGHRCINPTGPGGHSDPGAYKGQATAEPWCFACAPPDPFFAPCAGAAYTYPYDDLSTRNAQGTVTCCIGTGCPSTGREGNTAKGNAQMERDPPCGLCSSGKSSKRDLEEVFEHYEKEAKDLGPNLVPRRHKHRHSHAHAHGGHK